MRTEGNKIIVQKMKEHRLCSERYSYGSLSPESTMFLKSPVPMKRSESKCTQEIEQGIIKSVVCKDETELTPTLGYTKYIMATQKSTLRLKTVTRSSSVPQLSEVRPTKLWYDFTVGPRNASAIPDMESKLKELSQSVEQKMKIGQTSQMFSDLLKYMNQVPEQAIKDTFQKVKNGQFGKVEVMEKLFLDAVGSTVNNGAIPVMVQELIKGERTFEFTRSLFTFPRVCRHGLRSLEPLFTSENLSYSTIMAAGTAVGTFCKTEGSAYLCETIPEVQEIMSVVSNRLTRIVNAAKTNDTKRKESIAVLKAIVNMRGMSMELESKVLSILEHSETPISIRVAAAETLKFTKCRHDVSSC